MTSLKRTANAGCTAPFIAAPRQPPTMYIHSGEFMRMILVIGASGISCGECSEIRKKSGQLLKLTNLFVFLFLFATM
jgi:hypothetical protein